MNKSSELKEVDFEHAVARLEKILNSINDETPLEDTLKMFEEATSLMDVCQKKLENVELEVNKLIKDTELNVRHDEHGEIEHETFNHEE